MFRAVTNQPQSETLKKAVESALKVFEGLNQYAFSLQMSIGGYIDAIDNRKKRARFKRVCAILENKVRTLEEVLEIGPDSPVLKGQVEKEQTKNQQKASQSHEQEEETSGRGSLPRLLSPSPAKMFPNNNNTLVSPIQTNANSNNNAFAFGSSFPFIDHLVSPSGGFSEFPGEFINVSVLSMEKIVH